MNSPTPLGTDRAAPSRDVGSGAPAPVSTPPHEPADPITFTVPARFNGPPDTANGGFACGLFATLGEPRPGIPAITLLEPPPLDAPLEFHPGGRRSQIRQGDRLIATVASAPAAPEILEPVPPELALEAARNFQGDGGHPFRTCFVCGVDRAPGDGLLLTPGPVPGLPGTVSCLWTPDDTVTEDGTSSGAVRLPVVWGVLDCPGGWTEDPAEEPMVLSRMTAQITERPRVGRTHVVVGRRMRRAGRTAVNATALYDAEGRLLAHASAVWAAVNDTTTDGARRVHL